MEQPSGGAQNVRQGCVYNLTCDDSKTDPAIIEGTLFFSDFPVYALIDLGATHSFVPYALVGNLKLELRELGYQMVIATPMGTTLETAVGCQECIFSVGGENLRIDLAVLDIQDFDMIIGIVICISHTISYRLDSVQ